METTILETSTLVAVVLGLTQLIKMSGVSSRYIPAVAVCLGILASILMAGSVSGQIILQGVIASLTACGLYSGGKATLTK